MPANTTNNLAELRAGVDIGGTFTDVLLYDGSTGSFTVAKTLTTPDDPSTGVTTGLEDAVRIKDQSIEKLEQIVHGTTLVTNALIERKGAKTALITTKGFRDALEIAREHRYDIYDLMIELPQPLAPRYLRFEIDERILSDGSIDIPFDPQSLLDLIPALQSENVEAVAICFMNSYVNPAHEQEASRMLQEAMPEVIQSISSDVDPEIREFERSSTTVANVYVRPLARNYLERLDHRLTDEGFSGNLLIMLSSGGLCTLSTAMQYPIRLVESGPAAGALAAAHIAGLSGRDSLLSFDMGGTTAKACLIQDAEPTHSSEFEVSRVYRFKKGSGLPVAVPVIEMIEIGSGGGSIARIDNLGLLKVGPESAGADPGPACYGRGGSHPTVTDADLVLGYLDPDHFLGGKMTLDVEAARAAIAPAADELGYTIERAAWGIHQIVNEQMASAARIHAIERGEDARLYPLFAFGGAGPVHAYGVASILRSPEIMIPFAAGVGSTIGFLVAPVSFDFVRTYIGTLNDLDWTHVNDLFDSMENEGRETLQRAGVADKDITIVRQVEMRYAGQGHEVPTDVPDGPLDEQSIETLEKSFEDAYQRIYGRRATGNPIETVNWRVVTSAPTPNLPISGMGSRDADTESTDPVKGTRSMFVPESESFEQVPVLDRYQLQVGAEYNGPVIVEERESTTIVGSSASLAVDNLHNLVLTMDRN